jgi:hypothetical protein
MTGVKKMKVLTSNITIVALFAGLILLSACGKNEETPTVTVVSGEAAEVKLTDEQVENIVRRSYQYVALYNVVNKFAMDPRNPMSKGWNTCEPDTALKDHTLEAIARPNNDTLYIGCFMDLGKDPVIIDMPAFDSKYVSLMAFGYDHYVYVPLTTRKGDFDKPEKMLFYSARTEGYNGEPVEGVDRIFEMNGDFSGAVFRVMPHSADPMRFDKILGQMKSVNLQTLSEYNGGNVRPIDDVVFPAFGMTDADVFGDNFLEVMQFVFNQNTFDPNDELDQAVLAALKPLGVEPGKAYDAANVAQIDGDRFRQASLKVQAETLKLLTQPGLFASYSTRILREKGGTDVDALVIVSVIGPIGLPLEEATYPNVSTTDGAPLNAQNDYVIRMSKDGLPPANAFWSLTLYDLQNGFFIPNDRKKYSVGENAGMQLNAEGGIDIYVAAKQPEGVPEENWLPINRKDENMDIILRIYVPDLEKLKAWETPGAEMIKKE